MSWPDLIKRQTGLPLMLACAVFLTACGTTQTTTGERAPDAAPTVPRGPMGDFELGQFQRAKDLEQKGQLAEAAWAWEVLTVLRPQDTGYRDRLAAVQAQIDAGVTDRLQKGQQAQAKGDLDGATLQYLTALSLQPDNAKAADALRAIEKDRNKRAYLGTPSRISLRRTQAEPKPLTAAQAKAVAAKEAAREAKEAKDAAKEVAAKDAAAKMAVKEPAKDAKVALKEPAKDTGKAAAKDSVTAAGKDSTKDGAKEAVKEVAVAAAPVAPAGKGVRVTDAPAGPDRNELEHIAMLSAQGEVDEAINLLERRSVQDRKDPSARRLLADLYVRKAERVASADRAGAIGWLQKCLKIDEKHPRALALMRQWIDAAAAPSAGSKTATAAGAAPKQMR
ncbi:hypothetical protein SAMN05216359_10836 [Roseateles sp. YR242]|uniref:hypothetical protein n=1 Tax=Roseateles sp. YR242 TaxID=1855305 RepID=UPI0008CE0119|nr:hypothetical protein [Roseateles sp. YR242]SEL36279.1 hypothetical protein SAMN05216359_10836 [Roseateles sp. YR242]